MTVVTLRPNSTDTLTSASVTGAASAHAALSDNKDSSYITAVSGLYSTVYSGLPNPSIPAGAVVKTIAVRARLALTPGGKSLCFFGLQGFRLDAPTINVTWTTPTTITVKSINGPFVGKTVDSTYFPEDINAALLQMQQIESFGGDDAIYYEGYVDVTYVEKPEVTVDAPAGEVTDTNLPTVSWTPDLDADGGAQTFRRVKIFSGAQYGAGGFDPFTSPPTLDSGELSGATTTWQSTTPLPDGTYRAYVIIGQTVNGATHLSDYEYTEFEIDVALPAVPDLTLTPQDDDARMRLDVEANAGAATTDAIEIEVSHDGGTMWGPLRSLATGAVIAATDATLYDFEGGNGETVHYRARALHDYAGVWAASAWATGSDSWTSPMCWLKHPTLPELNTPVRVHSYPESVRTARQGIFQPLGRRDPVVVSDVRATATGTVVLWADTEDEQAALDALLDAPSPLLLQMRLADKRPDRWLVFGEQRRGHVVDKLAVEDTTETLPWTEVARPAGDIVAWPEESP